MLDVVLEKVKAHSEDKQNERADQIAKEGGEANVSIRVKQVITESMVFRPVWKEIEIECSLRGFIKQLLTTATRAEWTFNQEAYDEIHQNIKEELKQKKKIDLGSNWLREVFIPRDKEEYRNWHIEWSRGFLADDIGLALERMNLFKNKAQDTAINLFPKRSMEKMLLNN
ncbi:7617_t:CDS:2 [Gigaspora margarita]|uniref:7617_t:CDS:1 n=1 Tax=Gigaspora margarita TaxID=4874 RepID=A0ABN7VWR8_GIGMA|nr:7617_t:CDS:2 [Gigaspora margarita]